MSESKHVKKGVLAQLAAPKLEARVIRKSAGDERLSCSSNDGQRTSEELCREVLKLNEETLKLTEHAKATHEVLLKKQNRISRIVRRLANRERRAADQSSEADSDKDKEKNQHQNKRNGSTKNISSKKRVSAADQVGELAKKRDAKAAEKQAARD